MLKLARVLKDRFLHWGSKSILDQSILDQFATTAPDPQNALDIFKGEWASKLPGPWAKLRAGQVPLFEDPRVIWGMKELGEVEGKTVLELGPLEGGHSYVLEQMGAASITAIEGNHRAYLKCLIVKELLGLRKSRFLCGDLMEYLRLNEERFDIILASGVLYHMREPVKLIERAARLTDRLLLWTHYHDRAIIARAPLLTGKFSRSEPAEHAGFRHTLHRQEYQQTLFTRNFLGGNAAYSHWMERADILNCLRHFGFTDLRINFEDPHFANGPCFTVAALKGH